MRKLSAILALSVFFAASCAGGPARYGCPAIEGSLCKSVSEIYREEIPKTQRLPLSSPKPSEKIERKVDQSGSSAMTVFSRKESFRNRTGAKKREYGTAKEKTSAPVYRPPEVIRLWIAPWQDSFGVFHSEKHVYMIIENGGWTIDGEAVPLFPRSRKNFGDIKLKGAARTPR